MGLKICEFLNATDLVNLCLGISNWSWILSTPRFSTVQCQHINQWTWLDRHLYFLLFPQSSEISLQNASEAIRYKKEQTDHCERVLCNLGRDQVRRTIHFRLLPDFNAALMSNLERTIRSKALNFDSTNNLSINNFDVCMHVASEHGCIFVRDAADSVTRCVSKWSMSNHGSISTTYSKEQGRLDCCDCLIYLADPLRFLRDDFMTVLGALSPHQILIIAVIINGRRNKSSKMDCLVRFLQSLGEPNTSPLTAVPTNWRLWCIKLHQRHLTSWSNLLRWGCYDMILRRAESATDDDCMPPKRQRT